MDRDNKTNQQAAANIVASLEEAKKAKATAGLPTKEPGINISRWADPVSPREETVARYMNFNRGAGSLLTPERHIVSTTMGIDPSLVAGAGGMSAEDAARAAAEQLGGLGDRSGGIASPENVGSASPRRVATSVRMGGAGPEDYRQYEYGVDDYRGAVEGGAPQSSLHQQEQFWSGTTPASQVYGQFRSMDGKEGNPYYLTTATSPVYTTVAPFKVKIPEYNLEVTSATTSPEKLVFDIATVIQGVPRDRFIGYKKVPEIKEGFLSAFIKGIENMPETIASAAEGTWSSLVLGIDALAYGSETALGHAKQRQEWWNKNFQQKYYELNDSAVWGDDIGAKIGYAIPGAAASFAAIAVGNALGGAGGTLAASAMLNAGEAVDISIRAQENGVSPDGAVWSGFIGAGAITALDSLGVRKSHMTLKAAIGDTIDKIVKRSAQERVAGAVMQFAGDVAVEGVTEGAQEAIGQLLSRDLLDGDKLADNLTDIGVATLVGALMRMAAAPIDIKKARQEGMLERVIKGEVAESASELEKAFNSGVDVLVQAGLPNRQAAAEALMYLASDEGRANIRKFVDDVMAGELDKMNPETIAGMKKLPKWLKDMAGEGFKSLDAAVLSQLPDSIPDSTKTVLTRAMRGIVSVIGAYRGQQLNIPTIKVDVKGVLGRGENARYDGKTNTILISQNPVFGRNYDSPFVENADLAPIAQRDASLLEELGHYLDYQLGVKGKGFKEFLPQYFGLISKVYGRENAAQIKEAYTKDNKGKRFIKAPEPDSRGYAVQDTTEWFAHAVMRMGAKLGAEIGLAGNVADYINVANIMGRHMLIPSIQEAVNNLRTTLDETLKKNGEVLSKMMKKHGEAELAKRIQDYIAGDINALTAEEAQGLYNMLTTFVGSKELQLLKDAMPGETKELFMERTRREFQEAIAQGIEETGQNVNAEAGQPLPGDGALNETIDQSLPTADYSKSSRVIDPARVAELDSKEALEFLSKKPQGQEGPEQNRMVKERAEYIRDVLSANGYDVRPYSTKDSNSQYYTVGDVKIRVSNHGTSKADGMARVDLDVSKGTGTAIETALSELERLGVQPTNDAATKYSRVIPMGDRAMAAVYNPSSSEVMSAEAAMQNQQKQRARGDLKERIGRKLWGRTYEEDAKTAMDAIDGIKKMPKWFNRFMGGRTMSGLDDFLWLFGGSKLGEQFQLATLANRQTKLAFERRENFIKGVVGDGKLFKSNYDMDVFVNKLRDKNIKVDGLVDPATGEVMGTVYTDANHAMNVYLRNKNSLDRARVLQAFNGNEAAMQAVINQLTPEQKAYADAMMEDVKTHWDEYLRSYNEEGVVMDDAEPYWPAVAALRALIGDRTPNSAYSRDRTKQYAMDVLEVGALELHNMNINRVAGAQSNFYRTLTRIKDLFGYEPTSTTMESDPANQSAEAMVYRTSQELRAKLASKVDPRVLQNFNDLVDDFVKQRDNKVVGDSAVDVISRNVITNLFMFKPIQLAKNFANVTGWWGQAENQGQYWADFGYATTHLKEATKYMLDASTILRERWAGKGLDEQLGASAATGGDSLLFRWTANKSNLKPGIMQMMSNYQAMTKRLTQAGVSPMLAGDLMANVIGGYPILKQLEAKYGDKTRAVEEFELMLARHQSSTNQAMRSLMQREWNRDIRGQFIALTAETATKGKSVIRSIADLYRGERSVGSVIKENASTLMSIVMFSLLAAGIWDLFDDDPENDQAVYDALIAEGVTNLLGVNPLGSSFITPLVTGVFTDYDRQLNTPLTAAIAKDLNSLSKGEWREVVADAGAMTGFLMGSPQLMNSLNGLTKVVAPEQEGDVKAGILQLSGKSRASSERSAGVKKKKIEKKDDED